MIAPRRTEETKYAYANVKDTLSEASANLAVMNVIKTKPDLFGLGEWAAGRASILNALDDYRWIRPKGRGGPVGWLQSRYGKNPLWYGSSLLAKAGRVGRLPGRRTTLPDSIASVVCLYDKLLDVETVVINAHLTAEVERRGYRTDKSHRLRVARHKAERRALTRLVRKHERKGRAVSVVVDTNFHMMPLPPLTSCWKGHPSKGTLGNRTIDHIYRRGTSLRVQTIPTPSDHHAVVAVYKDQRKY